MEMSKDREWLRKMAAKEDGQPVGCGLDLTALYKDWASGEHDCTFADFCAWYLGDNDTLATLALDGPQEDAK